MSRNRPVPALLLALVGGLVLGGLTAAPAQAAPEQKIWGIVVDGKGKPVLDAKVTAVDADGDVVASDLSYDDPDGDHAPRPGYFELYVGANGTFTVTLKKKGFDDVEVPGVKVARGERVVDLGEVDLQRTTSTTAKSLGDVRVGEKGKVKVTVDPTDARPTGKVAVHKGKKLVGEGTLKRSDKGVVTITLDKLTKGTHDLKATYAGNAVFGESTSKAVTLTVKPAKKKDQRPNARAWVA